MPSAVESPNTPYKPPTQSYDESELGEEDVDCVNIKVAHPEGAPYSSVQIPKGLTCPELVEATHSGKTHLFRVRQDGANATVNKEFDDDWNFDLTLKCCHSANGKGVGNVPFYNSIWMYMIIGIIVLAILVAIARNKKT
jgi:hypothetical protein